MGILSQSKVIYQGENEDIKPPTTSEILFPRFDILLLLYTAIYVILAVILFGKAHLYT